jgi:hypothetical protein
VIENRVLRRIFGPKRVEVTRGLRKLHDEELPDLYSSPSRIRMIKPTRMRWTGHVERMERRETHDIIGGKARRKELLRRPRQMCIDNINWKDRIMCHGLD